MLQRDTETTKVSSALKDIPVQRGDNSLLCSDQRHGSEHHGAQKEKLLYDGRDQDRLLLG